MRRLTGLAFLLAMLAGLVRPPAARAQDEVTWLYEQVNALRASLGLYPYTLNGQLSAAALQQSQYLADTCNVSHTWPDGTTPAMRAAAHGYGGDRVIENIFAGGNARASDAWAFWIASGIHYEALTHTAVNEIGIGVAHGGACGHAYTLVFGRGGSGPPPVANSSGADNSSANDSGSAAVAAAPAPYVPPPPSRTPTPTISTLTPSATWTLTPTHTPSATPSPRAGPGTPVATLRSLDEMKTLAVAQIMSPTATPTDQPLPTPTSTLTPTDLPPSPTAVPVEAADSEGGLTPRDLVPVAIVAQIVIVGVAGFVYFRRSGS